MSERAQLEANLQLARAGFSLAVALTAGPGCTGIIGPSGSGKTTLLRCLAGLERAASGTVRVAGQTWQDGAHFVPAHERSVGYVFQHQLLFPHLSVRRNLLFGFERVAAKSRKVGFDDAVSLLRLEALLGRAPHTLSGGERQRVALARALLTSPALLLLDEPLASLDLASRAEILPYLEDVLTALSVPMMYVTHSPAELARLAEHVLYMEAGRVRAFGELNQLLTRPDLPLSHLEDAGAVLSAEVAEQLADDHLTRLRITGGSLLIAQRQLRIGQKTRVHIRARDVSLCLERPLRTSISNVLAARVLGVHQESEPAHRLVRLSVGDGTLLARVTALSVRELQLTPGMALFAQVKSVALVE